MPTPRDINALLMTYLMSSKASDGICRLLTPASLSQLTGKGMDPKVQKVEEVMEHARKVCEKREVEAHQRTKLLGQLDVRCITHIMKIEKEHENVLRTSSSHLIRLATSMRVPPWRRSGTLVPWRRRGTPT